MPLETNTTVQGWQRMPRLLSGVLVPLAALTSETATAATFSFRTGFVHVQRPAVDFLAIESGNRTIRFSIVAHFDESKSSGLPRVPVGDEVHTLHAAICLKQGSNRIFSGSKAEVSYKNVFH